MYNIFFFLLNGNKVKSIKERSEKKEKKINTIKRSMVK